MARFKLTIEYDGRNYAGWQRQKDQPSVQQTVEEALAAFTNETCGLIVAGRTDSGVHATAQVAHVDLTADWQPFKVREAANHFLRGSGVAILEVEAVDDAFNARFSAKARHYRYRIINRQSPLTFEAELAWQIKRELDTQAMDAAAKVLLGQHDFTTFRNVECQAKSPIRTLDRLDVVRSGAAIDIFASARAFLHNQVRSMVGSLVNVGDGKWSAENLKSALDAADRARCGQVAPPDGLYLIQVDY